MRNFLGALKSKSNRDVIAFLVPIVTAIAAGLWAVVTYFVPGHTERLAAPAQAVVTSSPANVSPARSTASDGSALPTVEKPVAATVSANNGVAIGGDVANSTITVSGRQAGK